MDELAVANDGRMAIQVSEKAEAERAAHDLTLMMLKRLIEPEFLVNFPAFQQTKVEKLLHHIEWEKRLAGLVILGKYCREGCKGNSKLIDEITGISRLDSSKQVRRVALHAIGRLLAGTRDLSAGKYLATVVGDNSLPEELRASAYVGLCYIHAPNQALPHEDSQLLKGIDKSIIEYYRKHSSVG